MVIFSYKNGVMKLEYQSLTHTPKNRVKVYRARELSMASILVIQKLYQSSSMSNRLLFIPKEIKSFSLS